MLIIYFSVPHERVLRKKWIEMISKHQEFDYIPMNYAVCEMHFDAECILQTGKRRTLIKGSLPTIFPE